MSVYRTIGPLVMMTICIFVLVSHFGFVSGTLVLIESVSGHFLHFVVGKPLVKDNQTPIMVCSLEYK